MINLISKKIVNFIINQNAIDADDKEVYMYGTEMIVSMSLSFVTMLVMTLILSKWYYFAIFVLFFIPLRMYAGGYHAETYAKCFITTMFFYFSYIMLIKFVSDLSKIFIVLIMVLSTLIVFKFAPIIHKNNIITETGIKSRKLVSRFLIILYTVIVFILLLIDVNQRIINAISFTIAVVAVSIIINILDERRKNNEKAFV